MPSKKETELRGALADTRDQLARLVVERDVPDIEALRAIDRASRVLEES